MHRTIFLLFILCSLQMMIAMDGAIKSKWIQIIELADTYLDHKTLCTVGLLDKSSDQYLKKNAHALIKKKLGTCSEIDDGKILRSVMHKYGGARCFVYTKQTSPKKNSKLYMRYDDCDGKSQTKIFDDFILPLPHNPVPFLNEQNVWCFDGCGKSDLCLGNINGDRSLCEVIRYNLLGIALPVIMIIQNSSDSGSFYGRAITFRNYINLLRSILSVKKVAQKDFEVQNIGALYVDTYFVTKSFLEISFNDVVLTQDWNKHERFLLEPDFLVFEEHSSLKTIIEKYYQRQCEKRTIDCWDISGLGQQASYEFFS